jgi:hypothetical protein
MRCFVFYVVGGTAGWTESIDSVVAQRIVESGIVVSISQGNSGSEGEHHTLLFTSLADFC